MKRFAPILVFSALLTLAGFAGAQSSADHSQHAASPAHGQTMTPKSIMLGEQTVAGVTAMAHLNDVGAVMAQMGKKENYHFMVMFSDAATKAAIEQGTVAMKIVDPQTGQAGAPVELMGMGNHFGADVALNGHGEYRFQVGTRLADGGTRQFQFTYKVP
ncbi:hypothetical protein [Desulfobulbus elongatus]|uniref:hypothetical protein n=1 Tax=Desulfobulbus elongatus TaxID=53332 RepID=UPI0004816096|nr:hypothetical protein [Desulfobulbus elongatus]